MTDSVTYKCPRCSWRGNTPRLSVYNGREWVLCPDCGQLLDDSTDCDHEEASDD